MATFKHHATGVELNVVSIRKTMPRGSAERETVLQLLETGEPEHIVAAMFGTNQGRIATIVRQEREKKTGRGKRKKSSAQPELF